jgi:hypothetical protein
MAFLFCSRQTQTLEFKSKIDLRLGKEEPNKKKWAEAKAQQMENAVYPDSSMRMLPALMKCSIVKTGIGDMCMLVL